MKNDKPEMLKFLYVEKPGKPARMEFKGPWTAMSLKRMIHKSQKGLRDYKRNILRRDKDESRNDRSDKRTTAG